MPSAINSPSFLHEAKIQWNAFYDGVGIDLRSFISYRVVAENVH